MAVVLSPIGNGYNFFNANGSVPDTVGFLGIYAAGTGTLSTVFTDYTGLVPQTNPIPLNPDGRPPYEVWWTGGATYKIVLYDASMAIIRTYDNIPGINDIVLTGSTATNLLGGTSGSIPYQSAANTTAMLPIGLVNQILSVNAAGTLPTWAYPTIPQTQLLSAVTTYTFALTDGGGHIRITDTSFTTLTIPANGVVPFPIGTNITGVNDQGTASVSLAITTDTLVLAATGTTGTRTIAPWGMFTLLKVAANRWWVNGIGIT